MSIKQRRVLWPVLGAIVVAVSAFVFASSRKEAGALPRPEPARPLKTNASNNDAISPKADEAHGAAMAAPSPHGPLQVVRFALYDARIHPLQARAHKGLVAITIEDLSGGTTGLVVERLNGSAYEPVVRVLRVDKYTRGRQEIQLQPGNYRVYMADRPKNVASLIVDP